MRKSLALLVAIVAGLLPSWSLAQGKQKFQPPEIKKLHVGFRTYKREDDQTAYKVGLWTPIYIDVFGGSEGIIPRPGQETFLKITTTDNDDVGTTVRIPCLVEPFKERTFLAYVKPGHFSTSSRDIQVELEVGNRSPIKPQMHEQSFNLFMDAHLYLTVGPRMEDFRTAIARMGLQRGQEKEFNERDENTGRTVVFEKDVHRLPDRWFGYSSVDLMVLSDQREFVNTLNQPDHRDRISAIAQWVRRGGRLLIPISAANQDAMHALLKNEAAWQPAIPVVPPKVSANLRIDHLKSVDNWRNLQGEPFVRKGGVSVATLDPGRVEPGTWEISAAGEENVAFAPLIAHVRYGLGQITYLAFSLQDEHFLAWKGREKFMQSLVLNLGPKSPFNPGDEMGRPGFRKQFDEFGSTDPATQLIGELEKFGVTPIEFGYVALFIVLYILIVGPLDFFLLKFVFKRLEWTWITFPTVVLTVSVIAYFAAYALKGKDLKINKVDIVDFDLRTSADPRQVRVYGQTFFALLSPRIQNYTVGIEPNPLFWGETPRKVKDRRNREADEVLSADLLSWLGRPTGGMNDMGRGGAGGFFRKPYTYTEDLSAVEGVPIPVWTTKAFTASWEHQLTKSPFVAELEYHQKVVRGQELSISGKLENHLGVDLVDVWLHYDNKFFFIEGGLKSVKNGAAPGTISIPKHPYKGVTEWVNENAAHDDAPIEEAANAQQTRLMKQILVHEKFDTQHVMRNHLLRPIDLGWRIKEEPRGQHDRNTREAILIGRVRYPTDSAEALSNNAKKPLPTILWLQGIPESGQARPTLSGQMNQDTYVRVILPVRPAQD